ncbi:MAG: ketopantoate reductase family protein [Candidatus Hodarchaeota archaeon]
MQIDIIKRKPTEIDFLNTQIVKLGNELGIDVPSSRAIVKLIKIIEEKKIAKNIVALNLSF